MKRLDYYSASWCGPCKMVKPIIEKLRKEGYNIKSITIDENKINEAWANSNGIQSVPTFVLYDGNEELGRVSGVPTEQDIRNWLA